MDRLSTHQKRGLALAAVAALSALYLLQMASPLRLTPDSVIYLSIGASAAEGKGFLFRGYPTLHPPGYPALVAALDLLGLGVSWAFVALNCLLLALGMAACYGVLRLSFGLERPRAAFLCCLSALSYLFLNHATLPLSDIPFFGVSMACLFAAARGEQEVGARRWGALAVALLYALAATTLRTAGVALLPALLWACLPPRPAAGPRRGCAPRHTNGAQAAERRGWPRGRRITVITIALALLIALAIGAAVLSRTMYFRVLVGQYTALGRGGALWQALSYRLTECGQVSANLPYSKSPALVQAAFPLIGMLAMGFALAGLWHRKGSFRAADVYVLVHMLILCVWPYWDARFWLPVLPLLMAWASHAVDGLWRRPLFRLAVRVYLVFFILAGAAALAYTTRISLSGRRFPESYQYELFQPTYRVAFGRPQPGDRGRVDQSSLDVLRRYEPRAAAIRRIP